MMSAAKSVRVCGRYVHVLVESMDENSNESHNGNKDASVFQPFKSLNEEQ